MIITERSIGVGKNGEAVSAYSMKNQNGMEIQVTNYGATLISVVVPDEDGKMADVALGYDKLEDYMKFGGYFGATIGRNGNRIGQAEVVINGIVYPLDNNENGNNLHSGFCGFDKVIWDVEVDEKASSVHFKHFSAHMDQGFPGNLHITVTYTLTEENEIILHYQGEADQDTLMNMTNHSYFNLRGHNGGDIGEHILQLHADEFTVIGEGSIPTGEVRSVQGTPMDFRTPMAIGERIDADYEQLEMAGGYDHNYVLDEKRELRQIAFVEEPISARCMEVYTDCVGIQFYTGNFIEATQIGKGGKAYERRGGFCLETQFYPDAIHHEEFPSPVLKAGEKYDSKTVYKFLIKE